MNKIRPLSWVFVLAALTALFICAWGMSRNAWRHVNALAEGSRPNLPAAVTARSEQGWRVRYELDSLDNLSLTSGIALEGVELAPGDVNFVEVWAPDSLSVKSEAPAAGYAAFQLDYATKNGPSLPKGFLRIGFKNLSFLSLLLVPRFRETAWFPLTATALWKGDRLVLKLPADAEVNLTIEARHFEFYCDHLASFIFPMEGYIPDKTAPAPALFKGKADYARICVDMGIQDFSGMAIRHADLEAAPGTDIRLGAPRILSVLHAMPPRDPASELGTVSYRGRPAIRERYDEHYRQTVNLAPY